MQMTRRAWFSLMFLAAFSKFSTSFRAQHRPLVVASLCRHRYPAAFSLTTLRDTTSKSINENDPTEEKSYVKGQPIKVSILKFGPLGASVMIDNKDDVRGLVLQREIAMFRDKRDGVDVVIGEVLDGFVERIREDGRMDVCLRPVGRDRVSSVKQLILDALEGSPTESIPIGDKSTPDNISSYLHGISKTDFKTAVGALYRDGLVRPGPFETSLMPDEERDKSRLIAEKAAKEKKKEGVGLKPPRLPSDRDNSRTIFIGNLPFKVTKEQIMREIGPVLGAGVIVDVRLSLNEEGQPKGFGYIDLAEESLVEVAMEKLKNAEVGGRKVRTDFADPSRSKRKAVDPNNEGESQQLRRGEGRTSPSRGRDSSWSRDSAAAGGSGSYDRRDSSPPPRRRLSPAASSSPPPAQWCRGSESDDQVQGGDNVDSFFEDRPAAPAPRSAPARGARPLNGPQGASKGWVRDAERNIEQSARRRSGSPGGSYRGNSEGGRR